MGYPPHDWTTGEFITEALLDEIANDLTDLNRRTNPDGNSVVTLQTTTTGSFTDLATAGPQCTVTVGSSGKCLLIVSCKLWTSTSTDLAYATYEVSGATTIAADANKGLQGLGSSSGLQTGTFVTLEKTLTPGSNTFKMKYKVDGGATGSFALRSIIAIPLGA